MAARRSWAGIQKKGGVRLIPERRRFFEAAMRETLFQDG